MGPLDAEGRTFEREFVFTVRHPKDDHPTHRGEVSTVGG